MEYVLLAGATIMIVGLVIVMIRGSVFGKTEGGLNDTKEDIGNSLASIQPGLPIISNLVCDVPHGIISWKTNIPSTGSVAYGDTTSLGNVVGVGKYETSHFFDLSPLTDFYYSITSCSLRGECAVITGVCGVPGEHAGG